MSYDVTFRHARRDISTYPQRIDWDVCVDWLTHPLVKSRRTSEQLFKFKALEYLLN